MRPPGRTLPKATDDSDMAYAEKNGITIVKHYIDRAISAKTDNRPEFQQMIKEMTEVYPLRGDVPRSFLFFGCLCRYHAVLVGADGVCIDGVALGVWVRMPKG